MRKKFTTAGNWPTLGCTALLLLLAAGATSSGRVAAQGQEVAQGQAPSQAPAPPGGPTQPNRLAAPQIVRELFVPFADLPVVLEHAPQRVLLTRSQYDQLLREAKRTPNDPAPRRASLVSADYEATLSDGRAAISGRIVVDVLERGVHVVSLSLGGVGLRSATLDGQPAPLAIDAADGVVLIVRDPGRKQLQLELVAPLETTAALQSLSARLPRAATSSMKIVVPGNVEVKSGAAVVRRSVDSAANLTRFELIPHASGEPLVMTLNNRQLLRDRVVISRSVLIDEVTQGYERLHATVSLSVLHGAADQFRFQLPAGWDVTEVSTPLLAKWGVTAAPASPAAAPAAAKPDAAKPDAQPKPDAAAQVAIGNAVGKGAVLDVQLREPATETVTLQIVATRLGAAPATWTFPTFETLDSAANLAVLGLLVEERLKAEEHDTAGLVAIDATSLARALPASVQHADPTAPLVRAVGAYYSPQAGGKWSAKFRRTDDKLKVTSNVRLLVGEQRLEAVGGLAIEPEGDKLFSLDLLAPPGWQVTQVTGAGNEALRFETFAAPMGGSRVHVRFPGGMPVGRITPVFFQAENTPTGWIGAWSQGKFDIAFPHFAVSGASRVEGAVAVSADEDLRVLPGAAESFQGLTPLDESEKARFSLAGLETAFAYRHDGPDYAASFSVERIVPTITARTLTFLKLDADNMVSHHELVFKIEQGRTRELRVQLPESTPKTLAVRGLGNVVVKEFLIDDAKSATEAQGAAATGATAGNAGAGNTSATSGWRTWRIVLAQHAADQVRLAIDFQQTLPSSEPKGLPLSLVRADSTQVNYQSGLIAVETAPELDVQLTVDQDGPGRPRKIDVGELAEADYVVGRRVLGAYGFVGGTPTLSADVFRRSALALPEAIVQRAELVTLVGATGRAATAARFQLRSKASFLELQLPEGAKLWSAVLDDQPMAPQRNDRRLLLSIPPKAGEMLRDVQVVYEVTLSSLGTRGTIAASAPKLQLREADGETTRDVQLADLSWQVVLPNGYRVTRADGTVFPDWNDASTRGQLAMRPTPWVHLARTSENAATWVGDSLSAAGRSLESLAPSAKFTMLADSSKSVARYTADFDSYAFRRGAPGVDGSMPTPSAPELPPGAFTGPMGGGGPPNAGFAPAMGGAGGGGMGGFGPGGGGPMGGGGRGPESGPMSGSGGMPGAGAGPGGMPGMPGIGGMPGAVPQSRAPADSRANRPRRTARDAAAETAPLGGEKSEDVGLDVLSPDAPKQSASSKRIAPKSAVEGRRNANEPVSDPKPRSASVEDEAAGAKGVKPNDRRADPNLAAGDLSDSLKEAKSSGVFDGPADRSKVQGGDGKVANNADDALDGLPPNVSSIVDSTLESSWALAGVRSLPFDFAAIANDTSVNVVTFRSLGQEPRLEIAVVDQRRLDAISWCIVFAIAASGVVGLRRSVGYRFTLVIVGMVVVTVLPIVAPWHQEVSLLADRALVMFAVVALVYVSLAIGVWADGVRLQLVERARQRRAAAQAEAARRMAEQQALEEQRAREGQAQATDPPSSNASPSATSPASSSNAAYSSVPAAEAQPADQRPADEKTGNASSEAMSSNGMNAAEAKSAASSVGDVNSPNAATASSQPSAASSGPVQNPSAQSKPSQTPPTSSGGKGKNHGKGKGGGGGKGPRFHLLLIFALLSLTGLADAQEPNTGVGEDKGKPVVVPADAIIVPFNPDVPTGAQMADKVFVPYDKYVALWNLAHPDRPLGVAKLPANFAWNGATYDATLDNADDLLVTGRLTVEVLADGQIDVPLRLTGGVIVEALVDGKPAQLRLAALAPPGAYLPSSVASASGRPAGPTPAINAQPQQPAVPQPNSPEQNDQQTATQPATAPPRQAGLPQSGPMQALMPQRGPVPPGIAGPLKPLAGAEPPVLVLTVAGRGRKEVELKIRMKLERRGGWRVAEGRLPSAPAASVNLRVAAARTEVRLGDVADRNRVETEKDNQRIETALKLDGAFSLQWRPKVAAGEVDRGLSATSAAEFDVREDGVRLVWQLNLQFPRGRRDGFSLLVPAEYLVEKVVGDNLRGWQAQPDGDKQRVEVVLLKTAVDQEQLTIVLSRRGRVGQAPLAEFALPVVAVGDTVLHQGTIAVRRSPWLDVRLADLKGLSRADAPGASLSEQRGLIEESPLGQRPLQSLKFGAPNFAATVRVAEVGSDATAELRSLLKADERQVKWESQIVLNVAQRPLYRVRVNLPAGLTIEEVVAPGVHEWSVADVDGRSRLTIDMQTGQRGQVTIVVRGRLKPVVDQLLTLPRVDVLDVARQEGHLVVQVDPSYDVRAEQLAGCEPVLLERTHGWLGEAQRGLARLAILNRVADYSGRLRLARREPQVSAFTVTNMRVTSRSIAETVLLEFRIKDAGVREVVFQLPSWMKSAKISAPLLRRKTIAPVDGADMVRVTLELQDEVMGLFRVLAVNDRLLTTDQQIAPIPRVETGRTEQRFVTLETSGRDEVQFDDQTGVDLVTRQQQSWARLAELFGDRMLAAYQVRNDSESPKLSYHLKTRPAVETVGARIALAQTELEVDGAGAYRAKQTYQVDNGTEQFLELELPVGAELWTALVAGEPVRPQAVPNAKSDRLVRLPLVKTTTGDLDYPVVVTYGGQLGRPGSWTSVKFPFLKTRNISVELSRVRLLLPETHRWFNFGGTLGQVNDAGDYEASFLEYQTKRIMRLSDVLRSDANGSLMKMRASNNLKQLADVVAAQQSQGDNPAYRFNDSFVKNNAQLNSVVDQARQQVEAEWKTQQDQGGAVEQDNRDRLQQRFDEQSNQRARNVVNQLGANFYAAPASPPAEAAPGGGEAFNANWFATNGLVRGVDVGRVNMGDQSRKSGVASGKDFDAKGGKGVQAGQGQEEIVKGLQKNLEENLQTRNSNPALRSKAKRSGDGEEAELQKRYQQRLEVQQEQAQSQAQILNPSLQNGRLPQMNDGGQFGGRAGNRAGGGMGGGAVGGMANGLPQQPSFQPPMPAKPQSTSPRGTTSGPVQNDVSGRNVVPFGERAGEKAVQDAEDKPVDAVEALDPYLTSLTVELPGRGVEFLFKTPRGDLEITATAVAEPLVQRLLRLVVVLIVVLGPGLAAWLLRHRFLRRIS